MILGLGKANPTAMLLSAASMLDHLSLNDERDAIRRSIYKVLIDGKVRTEDLGGMHNFLLSSLHYHCKLIIFFLAHQDMHPLNNLQTL